MPDRYVLVLAGGRGERFWPWSRPERPKQLLPLAPGGRSLLAATLERALRLTAPERVLVLTARELVPAGRAGRGRAGRPQYGARNWRRRRLGARSRARRDARGDAVRSPHHPDRRVHRRRGARVRARRGRAR